MGHVIVIFGTLIALNVGFGYWLSEKNAESHPQGVVEVEDVQAETQAAPEADKTEAEATPAAQ